MTREKMIVTGTPREHRWLEHTLLVRTIPFVLQTLQSFVDGEACDPRCPFAAPQLAPAAVFRRQNCDAQRSRLGPE
jgi:hypothetical protein